MTRHMTDENEWSGSLDPKDPDNFWIDDDTGERVNATTGERTPPSKHDRHDMRPCSRPCS